VRRSGRWGTAGSAASHNPIHARPRGGSARRHHTGFCRPCPRSSIPAISNFHGLPAGADGSQGTPANCFWKFTNRVVSTAEERGTDRAVTLQTQKRFWPPGNEGGDGPFRVDGIGKRCGITVYFGPLMPSMPVERPAKRVKWRPPVLGPVKAPSSRGIDPERSPRSTRPARRGRVPPPAGSRFRDKRFKRWSVGQSTLSENNGRPGGGWALRSLVHHAG